MKDTIQIAATADWHVGHPNPDGKYPSREEISASLQEALDTGVDAYILAGDIIDRGDKESAYVAAALLQPFVEKGLTIVGIDGNHDYIRSDGTTVRDVFSEIGVIMLEGQAYTISDKNGKSVAILGVSGELGAQHEKWWEDPEGRRAGRRKAVEAARMHREALDEGLHTTQADIVVVVTHRGIIPETVGTAAKEGKSISPHIEGFADIIDRHATRRSIVVIHGHDHGKFPWEGFPEGVTRGGVLVSNVAAPVRRREGLPLAKLLTF